MTAGRPQHGLWEIDFSKVDHPDAEYVKKMMVRCFIEAQRESIARAKESFGREVTDESIRRSIEALVRMTFKAQGADYFNPQKLDCQRVIDALYKKARAMGTPQDIADHHVDQLRRLLDLCPT